jgi:hypothetical protein
LCNNRYRRDYQTKLVSVSRGTLLVVDFSNLFEPLVSMLDPTLIVRCIADNPQISSTTQQLVDCFASFCSMCSQRNVRVGHLSARTRLDIVRELQGGRKTQVQIAAEFHCTQQAVSKIWQHHLAFGAGLLWLQLLFWSQASRSQPEPAGWSQVLPGLCSLKPNLYRYIHCCTTGTAASSLPMCCLTSLSCSFCMTR